MIGTNASTGSNAISAISIGYHADSEGVNTLSFGTDSNANGDNSVAIGYNSFTTLAATNSMAIGANASSSAVNSVAIGYNSSADRPNTVSVGSSTAQRQITYVAAGTKSTDAVNVTQLSGIASAIGGGAAVNADGTIQKPSYTIGGQTYTDVGSAITAAASGASGAANAVQYDTSAHTKVTLGGVGASTPVTVTNLANGVANSDAVNVAQLKAMGATVDGSGNATNSFVAYDNSTQGTITLKGANGTKISNVAAGALSAASMDAVNGSQLFSTNQQRRERRGQRCQHRGQPDERHQLGE